MKPVRDTNSEPGLPVLFQAVIVKDIYTLVTLKETSGVERFQFHLT